MGGEKQEVRAHASSVGGYDHAGRTRSVYAHLPSGVDIKITPFVKKMCSSATCERCAERRHGECWEARTRPSGGLGVGGESGFVVVATAKLMRTSRISATDTLARRRVRRNPHLELEATLSSL